MSVRKATLPLIKRLSKLMRFKKGYLSLAGNASRKSMTQNVRRLVNAKGSPSLLLRKARPLSSSSTCRSVESAAQLKS